MTPQPDPFTDAEVEALVHQCLAKDRAHRFQSARLLGDALEELLERHVLPTLELSRVVTLTALTASGGDLRRESRETSHHKSFVASRLSIPASRKRLET